MRVFVTGASGFVGSAVVRQLLRAGHQVTGLVRSEEAATRLRESGAETHTGNLDQPGTIVTGLKDCDAVIHTAFNHDFSRFKENCELDRKVILALGDALAGSGRPLVITSGIGLLSTGRLITEDDRPADSSVIPRAASEEAAHAVAAKGVKTYIVRLPPTVHDKGDHGFVPMIIGMAKEKGESVYIEDGLNHWPAVHRFDAANVYKLIAEKQPAQQVYHAVAEEGIPFRQIAETIGKGLNIPTVSKSAAEAEKHFTWFTHFAKMDCRASSQQTQDTLGWTPTGDSLMQDLVPGIYF
ncbi:MAG: 3-beta hydroxysteroid dehydrogenase [Citrobacter freundii]|nr:MAG: 3-beta hydroxysteroid dehydrogenase [Citrobacter freundii]